MSVHQDVEIIRRSAKATGRPISAIIESTAFAALVVGLYAVVTLELAHITLGLAVKKQRRRRARRVARESRYLASISGYRPPPGS